MDDYIVDINQVINSLMVKWLERERYNPNAFTKIKDTGTDIMACCPFHNESKPSFGIMKEYPYKYNCFSCGANGSLVSLIQHVHECNYLEALRLLRQEYSEYYFNTDINGMFEEEVTENVDYEAIEDEINKYRSRKHSYITERGISDYSLFKYEIGYDNDSSTITFPVRDLEGFPLFIIRRSVYHKYYNIPKDAPKGEVLYGLNYLMGKTNRCFIVEGPMDALSCYEAKIPSVGLCGRSLNDTQARLLIKAGIEEVTLFLDNDKWGILGTIEAYRVLEKYPLNIQVVSYPEMWGVDCIECDFSDPNDLLRAGLLNDIKVISYIEFYMNTLKIRDLRGII